MRRSGLATCANWWRRSLVRPAVRLDTRPMKIVVPCSSASTSASIDPLPPLASAASRRLSMTPSTNSGGVEDRLPMVTDESSPITTVSVKVPPVSTPTTKPMLIPPRRRASVEHAACVDVDRLPGDSARPLGGEVDDHVSDLLGIEQAVLQRFGEDVLLHHDITALSGEGRHAVEDPTLPLHQQRVDHSRADGIGRDPTYPQQGKLSSESTDEPNDGVLGCAVGRVSGTSLLA